MDRFEPEEVGPGIEAVLEELEASLDAPSFQRVEELVRLLTDLYGAGLARAVELAGGDGVAARLGRDELVGSLLALHGLHPDPLQTRAREAVGSASSALSPLGVRVRLVSVDAAAATVRVALTCVAAAARRAEETVRRALGAAAPEADVEVSIRSPVAAPAATTVAAPPPAPAAPVSIRLSATHAAARAGR